MSYDATWSLSIGGVDITRVVSLSVRLTQRGTPTLSAQLWEHGASGLAYSRGDEVIFTINGTAEFGGYLQRQPRTQPAPRLDLTGSGEGTTLALEGGSTIIMTEGGTTIITEGPVVPTGVLYVFAEAVGHAERLKKRTVESELFTGFALHEIVADLADNHLNEEGFTQTGIAGGSSTPAEPVSYQGTTVFDAYGNLASRAGRLWLIDPDKDIVFDDPGYAAAPWNVTDSPSSKPIFNLDDDPNLDGYANSLLIIGAAGADASANNEEQHFVAEETAQGLTEITLENPVHTLVSVSKRVGFYDDAMGHVLYSVGQKGNPADINKDVLYERGSPVLTFSAEAAPSYGDRLTINYTSPRTLMVQVDDATEIAARQAAEGGSGRYERIISAPTITDAAQAAELAGSLLDITTTLPHTGRYETFKAGIRPGQSQTIDYAARGLSGTYYIEAVDIRLVRHAAPAYFVWTVHFSNQATRESIDDFVTRWLKERQVDDPALADSGATLPRTERTESENLLLSVH